LLLGCNFFPTRKAKKISLGNMLTTGEDVQNEGIRVSARVQVEGISMEEEALAQLGEIGEAASLRHAVQLLTPAHVLAKSNGRDAVGPGDVAEVHGLFRDAKYTARLLTEQADKYIH
jgi:DNA helicase TIP49 (TBP-interacting protein)